TLENATGIGPNLTVRIRNFGSMGHQPASFDMVAIGISRGNLIARRQGGKLYPAAVEEAVVADEKSIGSLARKSRKDRFDLAVCAGVEDLDLQSHGAGSRVRVFQRDLRNPGIVRIDEYRHPRGYGYQLMQEFQALCRQLLGVEIDPRQIAARPRETRDKAKPDWILGDDEDGGVCRGGCLGRDRHRRASRRNDHCDLSAN